MTLEYIDKRRVLIIGLDGATFDLLQPLMDEGQLPNLRRIAREGTTAILESTVPPITAVAWTSFMTGVNPGKHGVFGFRTYNPKSQTDDFVNSGSIRCPTLWDILSHFGKRVCVVNLPMMYPPPVVNGAIISGFDTLSPESGFTHPRSLQNEILQSFPDYTPMPAAYESRGEDIEGFQSYTESIQRAFTQRAQLSRWLMDQEDWDVFLVQFQALDALQHKAWIYLDPRIENPFQSKHAQLSLRCIIHLDRMVGDILNHRWSQNSTIFVVSDHGFSLETECIAPNNLLQEWGYLAANWPLPAEDQQTNLVQKVKQKIRDSQLPGVKPMVGAFVQTKRVLFKKIGKTNSVDNKKSAIDNIRDSSLSSVIEIDWLHTQACATIAEKYALIYLNLKGREQTGIVEPGEAESLIDELVEKFKNVADPATSLPVFAAVKKGDEIYVAGEGISIPEIVLIPREGYSTTTRSLDHNGAIYTRHVPIGGHHPDGIFIACGPNIAKKSDRLRFDLVDIVPTVLAYLGLPIPKYIDGTVLNTVFETSIEVGYKDYAITRNDNSSLGTEITEQDTKLLEEHLRNLGYLQ